MNKCLKITLIGEFPRAFLQAFVQKQAKKLELEGTVQFVEEGKRIKIIVCGQKDSVDDFLDILHKGTPTASVEDVEAEPYLRDKDYRGVFRIIE